MEEMKWMTHILDVLIKGDNLKKAYKQYFVSILKRSNTSDYSRVYRWYFEKKNLLQIIFQPLFN